MASVIAQWCQRHGLHSQSSAVFGYYAVVIDQVRVRLGELSSGALVLESQIAPLPLGERERELLVAKAMKFSYGRIRASRARCVADAEDAALWLQIVIPGSVSEDQLSIAVEELVNEVERWRKAI